MSSRMLLPIELVLCIIESSVPHASDAILDTSHPTTKLLLAFTLVCHETRRHAVRYLRQHCVNLDSDTRLESYLEASSTQLDLRHITSLSLTPFEDSIENSSVCDLIRELLCHVCSTLKKLVVDIPLRFHRQDRQHVRPLLREAFECLVNLEEFVSIHDDADIESVHGEESRQNGRVGVWESWPKLKRLCLGHGNYVDKTFWERVALHPSLEMLLVCSISALSECDPKVEYLKHTSRPFQLVILDTPSYPVQLSAYRWYSDWQSVDPTNIMAVSQYLVPYCRDRGNIRGAWRRRQLLIKRASEDGSLWSWEGDAIVESLRDKEESE